MLEDLRDGASHKQEYQLWEAKFLRESIVASINSISELERNTLIGTGLVWTWLATHEMKQVEILWFLPVLFAFLGWLRSRALLHSIERTAEYIRKLESHLCVAPAPCGWETHLARVRRPLVSRTISLFWLCMLLVSIAVAIIAMRGLSTP